MTMICVAQMPTIRNSKDPAAEVRRAINLAGAASNTMIEVTCDASDPTIASSLLNITVDEYLAQKSFIDQFELTARQQVVKAAGAERVGGWQSQGGDVLARRLQGRRRRSTAVARFAPNFISDAVELRAKGKADLGFGGRELGSKRLAQGAWPSRR